MGDRANIGIKTGHGKKVHEAGACVVLYTHWSGYKTPLTLRDALRKGKSRWSDPAYLARIVFCQMVGKDSWDEETGFGISTDICDNEHRSLVVDPDAEKVYCYTREDTNSGKVFNAEAELTPEKTWTLTEFAALEFATDEP